MIPVVEMTSLATGIFYSGPLCVSGPEFENHIIYKTVTTLMLTGSFSAKAIFLTKQLFVRLTEKMAASDYSFHQEKGFRVRSNIVQPIPVRIIIESLPCLFLGWDAICPSMSLTMSNKLVPLFLVVSLGLWILFSLYPCELKAAPTTDTKVNLRAQKEKTAQRACLSGDMKTGIEILADLYTATNHLTYLYNQARCYQQNNEPEMALNRFREYLRRSPVMTQEETKALDQNMEECRKLIDEKKMAYKQETSPSKDQFVEKPGMPLTVESPSIETKAPQALKEHSGRKLKIAGAIVTSFGVCALATGGIVQWKRENLQQKVESQGSLSRSEKDDLSLYKKLYIGGYGLGAAAIVTGVSLFLISYSNSDTNKAISWVPVLMPNMAILNIRRIF